MMGFPIVIGTNYHLDHHVDLSFPKANPSAFSGVDVLRHTVCIHPPLTFKSIASIEVFVNSFFYLQ